ncbi:Uncharacterised protein [Legionella pneumophila]|nr:Uncharacterised protein [Legionella pneumophila]CZJ29096.1 Uncharacterised protein [Legionella pneumophila]CZJ30508.1 Uncharacterised protein [Legionella pneumophila]CZJ37531.1 Uncharacterised protein [Legionella pneumophila]CZJ37996.1 Uncharacterised protein [Legionella pneumophila]
MVCVEAIKLNPINFNSENINSLKINCISSFHVINKTLHLEF